MKPCIQPFKTEFYFTLKNLHIRKWTSALTAATKYIENQETE